MLHGFFTVPQLAQYAAAGVAVVARWAFALNGAFATIDYAGGRFDVAADYWLLLAHKRLVAPGVLAVGGAGAAAGSPVLAYASCALLPPAGGGAGWPWDLSAMPHPLAGTPYGDLAAAAARLAAAGNGSVVVLAVNPSLDAVELTLTDGAGGGALQSTPRLEWVITPPGGDLAATAPSLNGAAAPLRVGADGSLPPMPGAAVPAGGAAAVTLPPRSQAFVVLLAAGAAACK